MIFWWSHVVPAVYEPVAESFGASLTSELCWAVARMIAIFPESLTSDRALSQSSNMDLEIDLEFSAQ